MNVHLAACARDGERVVELLEAALQPCQQHPSDLELTRFERRRRRQRPALFGVDIALQMPLEVPGKGARARRSFTEEVEPSLRKAPKRTRAEALTHMQFVNFAPEVGVGHDDGTPTAPRHVAPPSETGMRHLKAATRSLMTRIRLGFAGLTVRTSYGEKNDAWSLGGKWLGAFDLCELYARA